MIGNTTLFQRAEFVEQGWRMVQPLLDAWGSTKPEDFPNYPSGSTGPQASDELLSIRGRSWHSLET